MEERKVKKGNPYPLGATVIGKNINFSFVDYSENESGVVLYRRGTTEVVGKFPFDKKDRVGNISSLMIENLDANEYEYNFYVDKEEVIDPYAKRIAGSGIWGDTQKRLRGSFLGKRFNWQGTKPLEIAYTDSIFYCMHTRGFTMHPSSKVRHRGTFLGIKEKIPYLKSLGITAIELMPSYEFDECMVENAPVTLEYAVAHLSDKPQEDTENVKLNYWGYQKAHYFAPKASYASGEDAVYEFKYLVRELHKNGIEMIMQFYFPENYKPGYILDVIKYWVSEYQIDGVHLKGRKIPITLLATDPMLAKTKLLYDDFPMSDIYEEREKPSYINLAYYRDDFMYTMRRFLKSDMDMLPAVQYHMRNRPHHAAYVNYITNYYGFTLNDLVSYERKHNEENGEANHDGTDYNYSWNCGIEGDTNKKAILSLRKKQIRNALAFVFLSQGTPLLLAGDEFGNSQKGNNNPYGLDNEVTWVEWKRTKASRELCNYVKYLISFRKKHPVLHQEDELHMFDTIGCGYPDLSYHGQEAWRVHLENYNRHIAMMYCGKYVITNRVEDDFIYIALNMHWEMRQFALPKLPGKMYWKVVLDTSKEQFGEEGENVQNAKQIALPGRSVCVLKSCRMKQSKKVSKS